MTKKEWPHRVTAKVHQLKFKELVIWLRDAGHELHVTVKFGKQYRPKDDPIVAQEVAFKDANQAMLFKLAWGGK